MDLIFKTDSPKNFSKEQKETFLKLLKLQDQVGNLSIEKIERCPILCMAFDNDTAVGIGAIKQIYTKPFEKAGIPKMAKLYPFELGYIFRLNDVKYAKSKIGKFISNCLLDKLGCQNVFATTEESNQNAMKYILQQLQFVKTGKTFIGSKTGKAIGLYLKTPDGELR